MIRPSSAQNLQKLNTSTYKHQRQSSAGGLQLPDVEEGEQPAGLRLLYRSSSKYTKQYISSQFLKSFIAFANNLETSTHSSTLAIFRILFSLVLLFHMISWSTLFESLRESYVVLHYPSARFITPLAPELGGSLLGFCCISTLFLCAGFLTRPAALFTFVTYSYLLHTCKSNYSDDHLLFLHVLFVGCFVKWHRWLSIDALCCRPRNPPQRDKATVPVWHVQLLQMVTLTPYLFSAISKLRLAWLVYAQPLRTNLAQRGHTDIAASPLPLLVAWTSLLFDLLVPPLLLMGGTWRRLAAATALLYQGGSLLYSQSWAQQLLLMAAVVLHLEPQQPARYLASANIRKIRSYAMLVDRIEGVKDKAEDDEAGAPPVQAGPAPHPPKTRLAAGLLAMLLFHLLFPLRHYALYPSPVSWTLEGHYGAWRAASHYRPGWLYLAANETSGRVHELVPAHDPLVNARQRHWVVEDPQSLLVYVSRLRQLFEVAGRPLSSVQVHSCFSLDGRQYRELYRSTENLLVHIPGHEALGKTGVGRWLHAWGSAPECSAGAGPEKRFSLLRRSREAYEQLQAGAELRSDVKSDEEGHLRVHVLHALGHGVVGPAYLWNVTY